MLPVLLKIGPVPIHTYGLLIGIGFLTALFFMRRDAARMGMDPNVVSDIAFGVLFLGLAGTRILYIIMFYPEFSWSDPIGWFAIWKGGLVFQGALPPAIAYSIFMVYRHGLKVWEFADVVCPYIPLGHAFGRMGCFMFGCCYGARTDAPWSVSFPRIPADAVEFPTGSPAFLDHLRQGLESTASCSYPIHPTQLYSAFLLVCLCLILLAIRRWWRPFTGCTFPFYLMFYGIGRFGVEFLRGDHNPSRIGGLLSDQQVFCIGMVLTGIILAIILRIREQRLIKKSADTARS